MCPKDLIITVNSYLRLLHNMLSSVLGRLFWLLASLTMLGVGVNLTIASMSSVNVIEMDVSEMHHEVDLAEVKILTTKY